MRVNVTMKDIRNGEAGECFRCAVALALQRATKDDEAHVSEIDWTLRLIVWGRVLTVPWAVRQFVRAFDGVGRKKSGRPKLPKELPEEMRPFSFTIPPIDDPEWEEECYGCQALSDPKDLDDEGYCTECHTEAQPCE